MWQSVSQYSLVSASCLKEELKYPRNLGLVPGKGRQLPFLGNVKAYSWPDLLKGLRKVAEGKGTACALATVTSDRNAASQEYSIAQGKHLHGRVVCSSCRLCHLAHIWLTQLDHFTQVFYFSAWHNTGKPHAITESTLPCSPVELADEGTLHMQPLQAPSPPSAQPSQLQRQL